MSVEPVKEVNVEMQIDSSAKQVSEDKPMEPEKPIAYKPVLKLDAKSESEQYKEQLDGLKAQNYDNGNKVMHQDIIKTLFKILENVIL